MPEQPHDDGLVPLHQLQVPTPQTLPFAIGSFDTIGPLSRASYPHRHTFHEIVYVTGGSGNHVVDLSRFPLAPPHLCFITPGQIHFWERAAGLRGWVILFDDAFLLAHPGDRELLRRLGERPWLRLGQGEAQEVEPLVSGMLREHRRQGEGVVSVLQAYLHILLVRAARLPGSEGSRVAPVERRPDPATALSQRFARLLTRGGAAGERSVRAWALELGVSVSYLGEAVKATTGRTPGQLIRQTQVLEAKRLLASTSLTVSRVAREVGFADAAYFCRFFRRETGISPGEFRREAGRMHHSDRTESIDHARRTA